MKQSWNAVLEALSFLGFQNSILSWLFTCLTGLLLLFSCPDVSDSFHPHGLQHARPPCPSPSPGVCPSSCSFHWWCRPAVSSSDTHCYPSSISIAVFSLSPNLQMLECPSSGLCFSSLSLSLGDLIHFQGVNHHLHAGASQTVLSNPQLSFIYSQLTIWHLHTSG